MRTNLSDWVRGLAGAAAVAAGVLVSRDAKAAATYDGSRATPRLAYTTIYLTGGVSYNLQTDTRAYGGADTVIHVLDVSLHQVAVNDDYSPWVSAGRRDSNLTFTAPSSGGYRVLVRAYNGSAEASTDIIMNGVTILSNQPFGSYPVNASWTSGQQVRAQTTSYAGSNDTLAFALDGSGNVVLGDDDSGPNHYSLFTMPTTGSGTIIRGGYPGQNWMGTTLTVQDVPYWYSYATNNDSDQDGLTDALEYQIGSNAWSNDSDSDTIPDSMEVHGNDGWSFAENGNPTKPNVWIELDYMDHTNVPPPYSTLGSDMGVIFQQDGNVISTIVVDQKIPYWQFLGLGGGCGIRAGCTTFAALKSNYFSIGNPERRPYFHYMIFGDAYGWYNAALDDIDVTDSSGFATGQDVLVTLGKTKWTSPTSADQRGTAIHEFGHDLKLSHNGNGNGWAGGPNSLNAHRSVMNYRYQLSGVPTPWGSATRRHTYSFGTAACDSCLTSPKQQCVDARSAGTCATTGTNCDCDAAEWGHLDYAFGTASIGASPGEAGAEHVQLRAALKLNQGSDKSSKSKSEVARWKGTIPERTAAQRKQTFEDFLSKSPDANEFRMSADGQEIWAVEASDAPR